MDDRAEMFDIVVRARRSVRAFLPDPVPPALIARLLDMAQQAPSNCNVQPWALHIASGATLDRLRDALLAAGRAGRMSPDVPRTEIYEGVHRERRIGAARALFAATGVARDDLAARQASALRNYSMFGAPHALFLFLPRGFGLREAADCGAYAQTFMLALTAHGLASCAQGALSHDGPILRDILRVDPNLVCLFGISFGYADVSHPANKARTDRASVAEAVTFHD
ncbi:nitroreductase [Sphingobium sp. AEW4]|nr:nitroreductase [Sphingobium sp. AEW4]